MKAGSNSDSLNGRSPLPPERNFNPSASDSVMDGRIEGYVMGFIDAEGSFSVSIKLQKGLRYGIRLDPVFSITQREREPIDKIMHVLNAGRVIRKPGQPHLYLLIIDSMSELTGKLIPFLERNIDLLHAKKRQYILFRDIVRGLHEARHRDIGGMRDLVIKAYELSNLSMKSNRRRSLDDILLMLKQWGPPGER